MKILIFALLFSTSMIASKIYSAEPTYPWDRWNTVPLLETLELINPKPTINSCGVNPTSKLPKCSEITDNLCQTLWSEKNQGSLKVSDGIINLGQSKKSNVALLWIADLQALIDSESRLPSDLKVKAKPIFKRFKSALENEKDSKSWYRSISLLINQWENAVSDVATERTEKRDLKLKSIKQNDLTTEQKALYNSDRNELLAQILEAKYAYHPNWLRVEKVYSQVKIDLLAEIKEFKIPLNQKQELLEKVKSVKLTLPYSDPNRVNVRNSCATTAINAFYDPINNVFTVCAGFFNSFQSESALYRVIAHELSHSIDPLSRAEQQWHNKSPLIHQLKKLIGSKGSAIPCDEWQKIVNDAKKVEPQSQPIPFDSMQPLYDCLQPKSELAPYSTAALRNAAIRSTRRNMSSYATDHFFLTLAQPTETKNSKTIQNEFYMRPDRIVAKYNADNFIKSQGQDTNMAEIFTQSLSCSSTEKASEGSNYQNASKKERSKFFQKSMEETKALILAKTMDWFGYCGRNCSELTDDGLSANSSENFADWLSNKTLSHFLERKKTMFERQESAALSSVFLCERAGPQSVAPDLAAIEKTYSLESHPDERIRRISVFNNRNSELINCEINQQEQGFGQCEL